MSDTNVGLGMVPCRKGCRCTDCQLEAKDQRIERLEAKLDKNIHARWDANARIEELEAALRSIAANTCCDKCQEAALVAREALAKLEDGATRD